jgi:beta-mannosidase
MSQGSLYWQLEDIWVAPTWSSVEYDGRWKILHYAAKDAYEPVIIAPYYNTTTGNLSVWVTSDLWDAIEGTATFEWYDWTGLQLSVNTTSSQNFTLGAINSTQVLQTFTAEALRDQDPRKSVLKMSVTANGNLPNSDVTRTFRHTSWFHPSALKDAMLVDPGLELKHSDSTHNFTVRATTGVAAWVWLEHGPGVLGNFGSNAFWLGRNESREVSFKVKNDTTGGKWVDEVTVQSLWNQTLQD